MENQDNQNLLESILYFDLDNSVSEYGFSTRLALENGWTEAFTKLAILEYKKFMYLAGVSSTMVSPSTIVDIVWHQHLIFTESYQKFCEVLGKFVQHVPSTGKQDEVLEFKRAKRRTKELYEDNFGEMPVEIWEYTSIYDGLNLNSSVWNITYVLGVGLLVCFILFLPICNLLFPFFIKIDNPYFLIGLISLASIVFIGLSYFNEILLNQILYSANKESILFKLEPEELTYLKRGKLAHVIHPMLDNLVKGKYIKINTDYSLSLEKTKENPTMLEFQIFSIFEERNSIFYSDLINMLVDKPIFKVVSKSMEDLKLKIWRSLEFIKLFAINYFFVLMILLASITRITIGIKRDKPVEFIILITVVLIAFSVYFLYRFSNLFFTTTLYGYYFYSKKDKTENPSWMYYFYGKVILSTVFVSLINFDPNIVNGNGTWGTSSSCSSGGDSSGGGDSCGGGCGGCGGD